MLVEQCIKRLQASLVHTDRTPRLVPCCPAEDTRYYAAELWQQRSPATIGRNEIKVADHERSKILEVHELRISCKSHKYATRHFILHGLSWVSKNFFSFKFKIFLWVCRLRNVFAVAGWQAAAYIRYGVTDFIVKST